MSLDPDVRDAYERAVAVVSAVRQKDSTAALAVVADLHPEGLKAVILALGQTTMQVLDDWCTAEGIAGEADHVWTRWVQRLPGFWDSDSAT